MFSAHFLPTRSARRTSVATVALPCIVALIASMLAFSEARANPKPLPLFYSDPSNGMPTELSEFESYVGQQVLADDFRNAANGFYLPPIVGLEWWGSEATALWQLTLYQVVNDVPTPILAPIGETLIEAVSGFDIGNGIFQYSAWFDAPDWLVFPTGAHYALSIASTAPGWRWALGTGDPGPGEQSLVGMRSMDGMEWSFIDDASGPNFAFRVWTASVPEPSSMVLIAMAGFAFVIVRVRGRRSQQRRVHQV